MNDIPAALRSPVVREETLQGGLISITRRLFLEDGSSVVLKQCESAPTNLYAIEARGLQALSVEGGPRVPRALDVGPGHLLLEDLGKGPQEGTFWEDFGRQVAFLHSHTAPQFGFSEDNYLGLLLMDNTWSDDGHEFFARTRILRFLEEDLTVSCLSPEDVKAVESIASRLPSLVPYQPPSLIHGDLWTSNMLADSSGRPAFLDPAVYYGWPEAELSMTKQYTGVPDTFFNAYREVHPLEPGWEERLVLLQIRELLSMIAHQGDQYGSVGGLRELLKRFA